MKRIVIILSLFLGSSIVLRAQVIRGAQSSEGAEYERIADEAYKNNNMSRAAIYYRKALVIAKGTVVDVTPYNNRINDLNRALNAANDRIRMLTADLDAEKAKSKGGKTVYVPGETKVVPSPFAIYFMSGKATLTNQQKNSIKYFVETAMAANPDLVYEVIGAHNSAEGSAATHARLVQMRVDAVLNVIRSCGGNYKISEKNLGGTDEFSRTDKSLNDVVVIK